MEEHMILDSLTKAEYDSEKKKWFKVGDMLNLKNNFEFNKFLDKHDYKENQFTYNTLKTTRDGSY